MNPVNRHRIHPPGADRALSGASRTKFQSGSGRFHKPGWPGLTTIAPAGRRAGSAL